MLTLSQQQIADLGLQTSPQCVAANRFREDKTTPGLILHSSCKVDVPGSAKS